jgi:hypothetical protein
MGFITAEDYVRDVCKLGKMADCCRYLLMGPHRWECGKTDPSMKQVIDGRVAAMTAKGDNCEGK